MLSKFIMISMCVIEVITDSTETMDYTGCVEKLGSSKYIKSQGPQTFVWPVRKIY